MSRDEKTEKTNDYLPAEFQRGDCCTYLLECADGTLYCGWTNDLTGRVQAHNRGTGGRYTRARRPVSLVYAEGFGTKQDAMRREWEIKRLSRDEKLKLIARYAERIPGREGQRPPEDGGAEVRKKDGTKET